MRAPMDWGTCSKEHIKRVEADREKIGSIRRIGAARLRLTREARLDDETAPIIAWDYYEVIKELLTALLLKNGLKSDNHECLIAFFRKNYPEHEYEAGMMHQLKEARNRVTYDGVFVKKDYVANNRAEFEHIIGVLDRLLDE